MKTWVIGNAEGSIGNATEEMLSGTNSGHTVIGTGTDVDVVDWQKLRDFTRSKAPFDNIVYCAGVASLDWIKDITPGEFERVFSINVWGFINVMKILSYVQDKGNVVVLISDSSHVAMRGSMLYCASKAALHQAVRVAARELAPKWRINGVSPSAVSGTRMTEWIDTEVPIFRGWSPDKAKEYELGGIPLGRRATKMEVARVIVDVLMGPEFMTGSIIEMTGGK